MEVIGRGFIARNLLPIADRHPDVTVIAAGVSTSGNLPVSAYQREAALVYDVIRECREQHRTVVFFSTASASMYEAAGCAGREDEPVFPGSIYGRHKLALETVVRMSGAGHLILRLGHVVGPHQPDHQLLPSLARAVRSGSVRVHRGAHRDVIDVTDVVTVIHELLAAGVDGRVVNVASGVSVPVELMLDHLEDRLGVKAVREFVDVPTRYSVSLARLRSLVPGVADMGFGPDYYRAVIDRYLHSPALATFPGTNNGGIRANPVHPAGLADPLLPDGGSRMGVPRGRP
jgi:NDP-hexose 4-ketoreductase